MKKLFLGFALFAFIGLGTVAANSHHKHKAKTEHKCTCKKGQCSSKEGCSKDCKGNCNKKCKGKCNKKNCTKNCHSKKDKKAAK